MATPTATPHPYTPPTPLVSLPTDPASAILDPWQLEEIKQGTVVDTLRVSTRAIKLGRAYLTVGRAPGSDIELAHPSVSRHHAVFALTADHAALLVADLGSTHGTRVNQRRIDPAVTVGGADGHVRLKHGDMVRFGESSRWFVVGAPAASVREQQEPEDDDDVHATRPPVLTADSDDNGVSWGFQADHDDADDAEIRQRHRDAALARRDARLRAGLPNRYAKNPRRSLADWAAEHGLPPLVYEALASSMEVDDIDALRAGGGGGHPSAVGHSTQVRVAIDQDDDEDGSPSELVGTGRAPRKRDAERAAAIDALTQLHARGLLQAGGADVEEAREAAEAAAADRARRRELFGDADDRSDDDEFYDRTAAAASSAITSNGAAASEPVVETYESLVAKHAAAVQARDTAAAAAAEAAAEVSTTNDDDEDDALDAYMRGLDRAEDAKRLVAARAAVVAADAEVARWARLVAIARPSDLAAAMMSNSAAMPVSPDRAASAPRRRRSQSPPPVTIEPASADHDHDDHEDHDDGRRPGPKRARTTGPARPPVSKPVTVAAPPPPPRKLHRDLTEAEGEELPTDGEAATMDPPAHVEWVPPQGQRGDGRTALNAKFGY
ncbi:hypothetical protein BC828DRAFT_375980 [Blastocladiella britannica]|nr:hypothetical protein BC828DRAFT_375980 [Blastocladiella britannica]